MCGDEYTVIPPTGVLQASCDYDNQLLTEGMETANKNLLLTSEALARCSVVQNTMQEW